jgi:hypothetical protein
LAKIEARFSKKLPPEVGMPGAFPNWLPKITTPMPTLKPAITGCEIELVTKSGLNSAARSRMMPASSASVEEAAIR